MSCNLSFYKGLRNDYQSIQHHAALKIRMVVSPCFWAMFLLASSFCLCLKASESDEGPILGNPMEKLFNASPVESERQVGVSSRRQFSDQTIPIAEKTASIRQASGSTAKSVWDQSNTAGSDNHSGFTGWGIGPPAVQSTPSANAATSIPQTNHAGNGIPQSYGWGVQGTPNGFNAGPMPYPSAQPYSGTNHHFNTGNESNASPSATFNPNWPSYQPPYGAWNTSQLSAAGAANGIGAMGFGYYDPATGQQAFGNPYSMQGMQYALQYGMQYGIPYGGNMAGMSGGYGNSSSMNPYAAYAMQGLYGNDGMQNPYGNDSFMNMMNGSAMQNPALYQAMLQQEMIRHQVALEAEEDEERKRLEEEVEKTEKEAADQWSAKQLMPVYVSSPLAKTAWNCVKTLSPFNTPGGPDRGVGMPLKNRSWVDRPYYFGGFVGTIDGSELVSNMIKQKDGGIGGLILGYNLNEYWGLESRLHFASIDIKETDNGYQIYENWYKASNPGATFIPPLTTRTNQLTTFDVSVHYYPLGNAKFRPFFKYGIGITREAFRDTYGSKHNIDSMAMPIGVGLRYWWNERLAIQGEIVDNVVFSRGITKTQNNWAFCVGITYAFGSSKRCRPVPYWPYTPSSGTRY